MTEKIYKLGNMVKKAVANPAGFKSFSLRNVATIIACLAGITMLPGCEIIPDEDEDKREYTITYRAGAHSSGPDYTQIKKTGEDVWLRDETYTRDGFTHAGWSTDSNGSQWDYHFGGIYQGDADLTLYPY